MLEEKSKRKNDEKNKEKKAPGLWTWKRFWGVTSLALIYGLIAVIIATNADDNVRKIETVLVSFLIGIPLAIGALSIYTIPPPLRTYWRIYWMSVQTTLLFSIVATIFMPIILLCVVMAIPLIVVVSLISSTIMWQIDRFYRKRKGKYQYSIVVFLLLMPYIVAPVESNIEPAAWHRRVENEITIYNTTPEEVWRNVLNVDTISNLEQETTWFQTMGIPRPVKATLDHEGIGGVRKGEFEYGLAFYEEVILWEPNHAVEFKVDIMVNPRTTPVLKQIGGRYFDVLSTGYEIEVIDETTVILRLHSQYRLSTNFNFYGVFWSDWIMQDFQSFILRTIKMRVDAS